MRFRTRHPRILGSVAITLALGSFGIASAGAASSVTSPATVTAACKGKLVPSTVGPATDPALVELSGIVLGRRNPTVAWVHNDSGDTARVFAVNASTGATRGTYALAGASAVDWEDIAIGSGPTAGVSYLYLGDIGDNASARSEVVVYRVAEPLVTGSPGAVTLSGVAALHLHYPDGAHDAESLLVDPTTGDLVIITKKLSGGAVGVYQAPASLAAGSTTKLTKIATLTLPSGLANAVTSAEYAPDGRALAIRTYGSVLLWKRGKRTPIAKVLAKTPCRGPVPAEVQGESIAFLADGRGYITVSEGASPTFHVYRRP